MNRPQIQFLGRKPVSLREAQQAGHAGKRTGGLSTPMLATPQISMERVEKVAGYGTAMDGIGHGAQNAFIWFRAARLPESLQLQGGSAVNLGCGVRLDVLPSVQIFSATPGAPVRGRISLALVSSGGRLGSDRFRLEAALCGGRFRFGAVLVDGRCGDGGVREGEGRRRRAAAGGEGAHVCFVDGGLAQLGELGQLDA